MVRSNLRINSNLGINLFYVLIDASNIYKVSDFILWDFSANRLGLIKSLTLDWKWFQYINYFSVYFLYLVYAIIRAKSKAKKALN